MRVYFLLMNFSLGSPTSTWRPQPCTDSDLEDILNGWEEERVIRVKTDKDIDVGPHGQRVGEHVEYRPVAFYVTEVQGLKVNT